MLIAGSRCCISRDNRSFRIPRRISQTSRGALRVKQNRSIVNSQSAENDVKTDTSMKSSLDSLDKMLGIENSVPETDISSEPVRKETTVVKPSLEQDKNILLRATDDSGSKSYSQTGTQNMATTDTWDKWEVPWGPFILFGGMLGVETCYLIAGLLSPFIVLISLGPLDESALEVPPPNATSTTEQTPSSSASSSLSSTSNFAAELSAEPTQQAPSVTSQDIMSDDDPNAPPQGTLERKVYDRLIGILTGPDYYKVLATEVALQVALGGSILYSFIAPYTPLPSSPKWFHFSVFPSKEKEEKRTREPAAGVAGALGATKANESEDEGWFKTALWGAVATFGIVIAITWLSVVFGIRESGQGAASNEIIERSFSGGAPGIAALLFTTGIVAPVFEETVFRGFLLPSLTKWIPTSASIGLSALLFALVHQQSSGDTLQLCVLGVINGYVYCKTRNLAAPIFIHAFFNSFVILLFLLWTTI